MICKKCGANIADMAKFCTECGSKVEIEPTLEQTQTVNENETVEEVKLNVIEPEKQNLESSDDNSIQPSEVEVSNESLKAEMSDKNPKKNNTLLFVILGIVLAILAGALLFLSLNGNRNSINVLKRSLANFEEKGDDSGTINLGLEIKSDTSDSMNLSATIEYQEIDDEYNVALTLNKSLLFDEMNLFAKVNEQTATLYTTSNVIDMLGSTQSPEKIWVYYLSNLTSLGIEETEEDIDLDDILKVVDKDHFKYVDTSNDLEHYQLIIDKELVEKINSKLSNNVKNKMDSMVESDELFNETYILDFYINKSNELKKISMDLTKQLNDNSISSAIISISFNDFGRTLVTIPLQALSSQMDVETYMQKYFKLADDNNSTVQNEIDANLNF